MKKLLYIFFVLICCLNFQAAMAQEIKKSISEMSREELGQLSYQDLMNLSLEDLMVVANKFGLSADEILQYFLNKDITSASKRLEKSINSPLSTTVLSRDEIIKSGANSIPEALRLVPGMIVREKTPGNFDVHIRGNDNLPPNNMFIYTEDAMSLVMIDGRPVYNYSFGGTFWETLPIGINDVERIEVIRGASSALYGANAVLGTINIITRIPDKNKLHTEVSGQIGNNHNRTLNGSLAFGLNNKFKVRMSGNYDHFDRFQNDYYIFGNGKRYSHAALDTATQYWDSSRSKMLVFENAKSRISDPSLATDKYGANLFLFYDLNKNVNLSLSTGVQSSLVQTTPMGNIEIPYSERLSDSKYIDLRAKVYGFEFQINDMYGDQDIERNNLGWYISPNIFNTSLEYEKSFGTLVLRPGISYQRTIYDDSKHLTEAQQEAQLGFLNGAPELNAIAGYLRADYKAFDKLRLIAAIRADKFNVPDKTYFTYQFITSYDINAKNVVRLVYSRANRGPFIVDSYANYNWPVIPENEEGMIPYTLKWRGNKNLNMPVVDMLEFGYRFQPAKNILIDLEAYYNYTRDINYFLPDSMTMYVDFMTTSKVVSTVGNVQYYNMDITSKQKGITLNVSYALNEKLTFKAYASYQQSRLDHVYPKSLWTNIGDMKDDLTSQITADGTILTIYQGDQLYLYKVANSLPTTPTDVAMHNAFSAFTVDQQERLATLAANGFKETYYSGNPDIENGKVKSSALVNNQPNKATPSFYGGFAVDYSPTKKLSFFASSYFYSKQEIIMNRKEATDAGGFWKGYKIDPKFLMNLKVTYKIWNDNAIFLNARNLFNNDQHEFAYTDKIKGTYMVGVQLNF